MPRQQRFSRRNILKLTAAAAAAPIASAAAQTRAPDQRQSQPRNVIFMVADGMSAGVPALAEALSQLVRGRGTTWHRLATKKTTALGQFDMASADSLVPESASSSSAWGCGRLVNNGSINVLPDGTPATPIGRLAKQAGLALGLVTTARLTDATPAGFAAVQASRKDEALIAPQFLNVADVLLGAGTDHFQASSRKDARDLLGEFRGAGYRIWTERSHLTANDGNANVLGLFARSYLPYTLDRRNDPALDRTVPTLAEMTTAALDILSQRPNGFLLQIEGGRVDHGAHANDAAAMIWEQIDFDDTITVAVEFADKHPETLIVITTDHGCGNPGLMGFGTRYSKSTSMFAKLAGVKASFETINDRLAARHEKDQPPVVKDVIDVIESATGIELSPKQAETIASATINDDPNELNRQQAGLNGILGQALGQHHGIGFTGTTHTSDWVNVMAVGPGSDAFSGLLKGTDAFTRLTALLKLKP